MDENSKVENKPSNNSMIFIAVMVVVGVVAVAGFVFMQGKKVETLQPVSNSGTDTKVVEKQETPDYINANDLQKAVDESGMAEALENDANGQEAETVVINVTAENFKFMPETITVKVGSKVKINFESTVGFHDFVVDEFNVKTTQVNTGGTTTVEFVASKVGTFEYYCSVGNHRAQGMVGKFVVTE